MEAPKTIDDILKAASEYLHEEKNINLIQRAYEIAMEKHQGQMRRSGEPYVQHPLEVAYLLATLHTGPATIAAGLVHDVLEDTDMTKEEMTERLGKDVADIVDGVTKISKLKYMTMEKALASDHQKILLAMAKDIRVVLVKLVDRLHNMRTLEHLAPDKRQKIAKETLDLYSPLAHRLGMYRLKAELEDLSLKYIAPTEYEDIARAIHAKKSEREEDINQMISKMEAILDEHQVKNYDIKGRIKNIYSIYKKISSKGKTIDDIYDLLALRIIVETVEDCYRVLGLVHSEWTPLPMRFKDYIAVPKSNLYQSLHTTVVGHEGKIFEIQIRTYEMDEIAELGVAAHWAYKENNPGYTPEKEQLEIVNKLKWYRDLSTYVEMSQNADPLDSIIEDIFSANVYIFTPKGDVIDLPTGSTPLDFAYRIHTEIGNKTVGAIVNGRIVPLNYKLKTGEVVNIKTNKNSPGPSSEWVKIVKTSHARNKIKSFLNKLQRDNIIALGKEEFERQLKLLNLPLTHFDDKVINEYFGRNNITTLEDLYYEIGKGVISARSAINRLMGNTETKLDDETALKMYSESEEKPRARRSHNNAYGIVVEGLDKAQLRLGNCCQPVYGDSITGYISKGSGIIVHREGCPNINNVDQERFINIYWDHDFSGRVYESTIQIKAVDRPNLVAEMINIINTTKGSIISVSSSKNKVGECITKFKLQVGTTDELNRVIVALSKISEIYNIERIFK
ncbi:MAG: bifunctional (p)ppGpp synthetase/guanosine-3',5'-bis(diphosphate) 3'-pyrophosphohydrolase [Bacilli bacterium]|nr:bifunctional (p)ppGpp synthetase/guanosine-3',5'-bis(diphosphate) 3'-pyrophosphohydrolase [Bacilli bacterium]